MASLKSSHYDCIILGGGIAGLGCAIPLAEAGQKVLVLDRSDLYGQATPAAGGILDPILGMVPHHPLLDLNLRALKSFPQLVQKVQRSTRKKVGYKKTGILYVAKTSKERHFLLRHWRWQKRLGLHIHWWDQRKVKREIPQVADRVQGGIYYPTVGKVNPRLFQKALKQFARKKGVRFKAYSHSNLQLIGAKQVQGVRIGRINCYAPVVVNAMGSWGRRASKSLRVPVEPVRGQIVVMKGALKLKTIVHTLDGFYMVPWEKGEYLLGSTVEKAGYRAQVTSQGISSILKRAQSLFPELYRLRADRSWAGLRPRSKDRIPILGRMSKPGLFAATGYYRSGILVGNLAGMLLAKMILTGKAPKEIRHFSPMRFQRKKMR